MVREHWDEGEYEAQVGSQAVIFKMKETKIMLVFNGRKTYRVIK